MSINAWSPPAVVIAARFFLLPPHRQTAKETFVTAKQKVEVDAVDVVVEVDTQNNLGLGKKLLRCGTNYIEAHSHPNVEALCFLLKNAILLLTGVTDRIGVCQSQDQQ